MHATAPHGASETPPRGRFATMVALVFAGEMIFSLPFHLPRYFRPSVLDAFGLSNAALGDVFAVYGVTAMLAYFPGGAIADRFGARRLMTLSLVATAGGGLFLLTHPGRAGLAALYGYWGVTTILLFWAALLRATRAWGGPLAQGRAFGLLDGGRGLAAAAAATLAVACFSAVIGDAAALDDDSRRRGLAVVIMLYSAATAAAGLAVWVTLPDERPAAIASGRWLDLDAMRRVLGMRVVWLQALVVVCAYCGYKGLDNYALYAYEVLGMDEAEAARTTAVAAWIRPIAAIGAGLLADRAGVARVVAGLFAVSGAAYAVLAVNAPATTVPVLIYGSVLVSFFAVFALRGVYFALLEESRVPWRVTGSAIGLVSVVGYTPDVFFGAVAGRLLDATPGLGGHQHYFILLFGIAIIGLVVALALAGSARGRRTIAWESEA